MLAEGFAGSEDDFAKALTKMGQEIGLQHSTFRNATGWPASGHVMSARDIAVLSGLIVEEFPEYYGYFAERSFTWSDIRQSNRNPLLSVAGLGADGLKTGHTEQAGYGLAASAQDESGRRLVAVVLGLESTAQRRQEATRILRWGFRNFETRTVFTEGDKLKDAGVWLGVAPQAGLVMGETVKRTASYGAFEGARATLRYEEPLVAPVRAGERVGTLELTLGGRSEEVAVLAGESVAALDGLARVGASLRYLLLGAETFKAQIADSLEATEATEATEGAEGG